MMKIASIIPISLSKKNIEKNKKKSKFISNVYELMLMVIFLWKGVFICVLLKKKRIFEKSYEVLKNQEGICDKLHKSKKLRENKFEEKAKKSDEAFKTVQYFYLWWYKSERKIREWRKKREKRKKKKRERREINK